MAIYKGASSIKNVQVGSSSIKQIYKGSTLIWERSGISLSQSAGTGTNPLSVNGGQCTITINCAGAWTINSNASWLSLSTTSGSNNSSITATATSNIHTTDRRSATVTCTQTSSGQTVSITIYQYADSKNYTNWSGGTISFNKSSLGAGEDSTTIIIQPWSRSWSWNSTNSGGTTEYYTGTVTVSENGDYTSLNATSYTGSSSDKTLTLTKSTCGTTITSAVTVTVTAKGATTTTGSISQGANSYSDSGGSTSYGNVTAGAITNATIPASGGSATAYAGNGSQTWSKDAVIRTFTSGSTLTVTAASNGTIAVTPNVASISASAISKGTIVSDTTVVKSSDVTWSANGKSASGTIYIYQSGNYYAGSTKTISANKTSVDSTGGSVTLTCTSTVTWSSGTHNDSAIITTTAGTLSRTSISGSNQIVTLDIPANSGAARDITVSITDGNSVTISQPAGYSSTVKGIYVRKSSLAPNLQYHNDSYGYGSVTTSWQKITSASEVDLFNSNIGVQIATDNMELEGNYYMWVYYSSTGTTTSPSLKAEHEYEIFLSPYEISNFTENPLDGYNFLDDYVRWAENNYPDKMQNCYLYIEIGSMV